MNKNTIIGFLIILISIQFFTSKFYYEKILRKPYPVVNKVVKEKKEQPEKITDQSVTEKETNPLEENKVKENKPEIIVNNQIIVDTFNADTFVVESDKIICSITEKGGRIISLKTKEYTYNTKNRSGEYIELINDGEIGGLNLLINNKDFDKVFSLYYNS